MLPRLLMIAAATLPPCAAQQTGDTAAWLQFIGTELRQLRMELLEQSMAQEGHWLLQTQRHLAALRLEQTKQQSEAQSQKQLLDELDKQASDPNVDSHAHAHTQAARRELASSADLTRVAHGSLTAREAELNKQMQTARARLQSIAGRLKQLSAYPR
jgi:hypothetical protein